MAERYRPEPAPEGLRPSPCPKTIIQTPNLLTLLRAAITPPRGCILTLLLPLLNLYETLRSRCIAMGTPH